MTEPNGGLALVALAGVGTVAGIDAGVLFGAFAGAAVFVLSERCSQDPRWVRWLYLVISVVCGVLLAGFVASLLDRILPDGVEVPAALGGMLAAALAVKLLRAAITRTELEHLLGKGKS